MTIHDARITSLATSLAARVKREYDLDIEIGSDFRPYTKCLTRDRAHQPVGAPFDLQLHNLHKNNAFWIMARAADGKVVHTQAMRCLQLGRERLSSYLAREFTRFPPVGVDLDLDASVYRPGPGARRITGNAMYHGELWIDADRPELRGSGLSELLGRLAFAACLERLDPDWIFGFVARRVAQKGLAERLGFMHNEPMAVNWALAADGRMLDGYMVYLAREDLDFLLGLPMEMAA